MTTQDVAVDPRIAKLPLWARNEFSRLTKTLCARDEQIVALTGERPTSICIDAWQEPRYLPDRASVQFRLDGGKLDVAIRHGQLNIMASDYGGRMIILPEVTNVISVSFEKERRS